MASAVQALRDLLDELLGQLGAPGHLLNPLVSLDPANPSAQAQAALARMNDPATAAAQPALRQSYKDDFGLLNGIHGFIQPWANIKAVDLEAVLRVATALGVDPRYVLALFIIEGKLPFAASLRGETSFDQEVNTATVAAVSTGALRSSMRSQILFQAFGCDPYAAILSSPDSDNTILDATFDHNVPFINQVADLRARGIPGLAGLTNQSVLNYFTDPAGAMMVTVAPAAAGHATQTVSATLRANSLASWLYLQHALFLKFKQLMEQKFKDEYGTVDLTNRPWVVYAGFNANKSQSGNVDIIYSKLFANWGGGGEVAIAFHFGTTAATPAKLSAEELARYDAPGGSKSSLANAIVYKYLVDSVSSWFPPVSNTSFGQPSD